MRTWGVVAALGAAVLLTVTAPAAAQQASAVEARLAQIRAEAARTLRERDSLAARLAELQGSVRNIAAETRLVEQQTDAQSRAVNALNRQLNTIVSEMDSASGALVRAQDELLLKQAALRRRLVEIYKRGPLYSVEALMSAKSFGELVTRYKYLRIAALRDRALVRREAQLRDVVAGQRDLLVTLQGDLESSRAQHAREAQRLRTLYDQWSRRMAQTQREQDRAQARLRTIAAEQARLDNLIETLEADRRRAAANPGAPAPRTSSLSTRDHGQLDWPVNGDIIFSFGRLQNPNNTTVRWDGIGIAAPVGTPVHAIADGVVIAAESMAGLASYGNCVIISHGLTYVGGGADRREDYSLYCSLGRMMVARNQTVTKGQVIGDIGVADAALGPHLHFQIREGRTAVDPLIWLRSRR